MSYKVNLQFFQGPLDLLLFLIKKERIDIYDIPILKITEQYLGYLELMKILDLEIAGEFLVMAATLMHIKSKMLLPQEQLEPDQEEVDPREDLVRQLLEYKKYKEAAGSLQEMYYRQKNIFIRTGSGEEKIVLDDGTEYFEASLFDLISSFRNVLNSVSKKTFHKVTKSRYTVSDKIHEIYHLLAKSERVYFFDLFNNAADKGEAIVIFLAILELIKMREIFIVQKELFSDIEIIRNPELIKTSV